MTTTPGLQLATRAIAQSIADLEAEVVQHTHCGGACQKALYAAHTAAYLRAFLAEFIGPTWHQWAPPTSGDVHPNCEGMAA